MAAGADATFEAVPAGVGGPPHPAILLLHGRGADERDLTPILPHLDPRLCAFSLRAPFGERGSYRWYEPRRAGAPDPETFAQSLGRLTAFLDALPARFPIDPARVFVLGFSQGAVMACALTRERAVRVAGTVMLSGYLPTPVADAAPALRGRPFFVAHGTRDAVLTVEHGRRARDHLGAAGAALTYREYPLGHGVGLAELADVGAWLRARIETEPQARPHGPTEEGTG